MMHKQLPKLLFFLLLFLLVPQAEAQNAQIDILSADSSRYPIVQLTLSGKEANQQPLAFQSTTLSVTVNGVTVPADQLQFVGRRGGGAFTIFLLDLVEGVEKELPAIKQAVSTYASPAGMIEQVDSMMIYRTDDVGAMQALGPSTFYNEVANFLSADLQVSKGTTALVNSLNDLVAKIDTIAPAEAQSRAIILFSDGTDATSPADLVNKIGKLAAEKKIRVHSVWIENRNISFAREIGKQFLRQLASDTGGRYAEIGNNGELQAIWQSIGTQSETVVVEFTAPNPVGGQALIEVSLPEKQLSRSTTIDIPTTLLTAQWLIPTDSRTVQLPDVSETVALRLPSQLSWLDGQERAISSAELLLNGTASALSSNDWENLQIDLPLLMGNNTLQLRVTDELGQTAQSEEIVLTVQEGDRLIPEALAISSSWTRLLMPLLTVLLLLGLLAFLGRYLWTNLNKGETARENRPLSADPVPPIRQVEKVEPVSSEPERPVVRRPAPPPEELSAETRMGSAAQNTQFAPRVGTAILEILEAKTQLPPYTTLDRSEFLIGRSPTVDLAFTGDTSVSRIHATIVQDGNLFRIYDEQSTSGTYVNERQVPEYGLELHDGDEIHLGAVHLRFRRK